ncbi:MAG: HAD family hydrolase [Phycisphaeraceae bacterium]
MKPRGVFLDRDNTIIHNDGDLGDPGQVRLIQGAASAIASLCGLGYKIVVVTNQGGVARGKYTEADVEAVHERIRELVQRTASGARIDRFEFCPFHPEGTVAAYIREDRRRKPAAGMIVDAGKALNLDLARSWTIGDQMRDIEAGRAAGTRTILLRRDQPAPDREDGDEPEGGASGASGGGMKPDHVAASLIEAVRIVAQHRSPESEPPAAAPAVPPGKGAAGPAAAEDRGASPSTGAEVAGPRPSAAVRVAPVAPASPVTPSKRTAPKAVAPAAPEAPPPPSPPPAPKQSPPPRPSPKQPPSPPSPPPPPRLSPVAEAGVEAGAGEEPGSAAELEAVERTLHQILQELRHQRGVEKDLSYGFMLAIVLQTVAGLCLLGALWMGADDADLFWRWLGAGLIVQGATIASLLFARHG